MRLSAVTVRDRSSSHERPPRPVRWIVPMQRTRPGIVAVLLVCACARTQDDAATRPPEPIPIAASAPSEPKAECGPPIRGAEAIVFPGSVTLLGEMHGTDAGPAV